MNYNKFKKIFLILIVLLLGYVYIDSLNIKTTMIVESKNYLTSDTSSGFKDDNLYQCVIDSYNEKNNTTFTYDDILSQSQLENITKLICKNKKIRDLSGLNKLVNLTELNLMENNISNIDLTNNIKLMYVELSGNPEITSIDLSKNTNLKEIYFRNDSLKNIDLSKNINLENLDLGSNELTTIDLTNNTDLKYVVLSSNQLSKVDISKNTKLIEFSSSGNKITDILLPDTDTLKKLDLHHNKISTIDLSKNTNLEYLSLSTNQLSSIDISKNINIKELYISSNNLTNLNITNLSKLAHLNAVLNRFDIISIPNQENIIDLVVESKWIENYDFSKFSNLKSLRIIDYYIIPVYGTEFERSNLYKYNSEKINYKEYILYSDFNNRASDYINNSNIIRGVLGEKSENTICSTNIINHHKTCGKDIPNNNQLKIDDNIKVNNLGSYSGIIYYEGYREFRFMSLKSNKYVINEKNNTINVEADSDSTIKKNLKVSWNDAKLDIEKDKLKVYYNDILLKEFHLERIVNPPTGSIWIYVIILISIVSLLTVVLLRKERKRI